MSRCKFKSFEWNKSFDPGISRGQKIKSLEKGTDKVFFGGWVYITPEYMVLSKNSYSTSQSYRSGVMQQTPTKMPKNDR